ncbi:MAG: hypothetical protein ACM3IK_07320, partial [Sphingomonadaceae bacterium]
MLESLLSLLRLDLLPLLVLELLGPLLRHRPLLLLEPLLSLLRRGALLRRRPRDVGGARYRAHRFGPPRFDARLSRARRDLPGGLRITAPQL